MMLGGMMFSGVISKIGIAGFPVDMELVLANAIAEPVKTHVHCFGAALDDSVSEYAGGTLVVKLDGGRALWVAHFLESGAHGDGVFGINES
jgi:hypothetical protein